MIRITSPQDFGAAAIFILIGAAGLWFGREYDMGTVSQMGTGYVPRLLSLCLVGLGAVVAFRAITIEGPPIERIEWRPISLVLAAVLAFALLIDRAGLAIATFAVVVISSLAWPETRWKEILALGVFVAAFCVVVFVYGLKQSIPIFW